MSIKKSIEQIINDSLFGNEIQNGYNVVLVGKPNAGKSSLFNRILAKERAIVSSQKGTTRDSIEANLNINGKPITLIDTAGIWEAKNDIDKQSVNKTIHEIKKAHICKEKRSINFLILYFLISTKLNRSQNFRNRL